MKSTQYVPNYGEFHYRGVDSHSKPDSYLRLDSHSNKMCSSIVFLVNISARYLYVL